MMTDTKGKETYTDGFKMKCTRNITKGDYMALFSIITKRLNQYYNDPNHVVSLDYVSNGDEFGFCFNNYPDPAFKGMKHWFYYNDNYIQVWAQDNWVGNDEVIIPAGSEGRTFVKSFFGAPVWTIKELDIFKECFTLVGMKCGRNPSAKSLIEGRTIPTESYKKFVSI